MVVAVAGAGAGGGVPVRGGRLAIRCQPAPRRDAPLSPSWVKVIRRWYPRAFAAPRRAVQKGVGVARAIAGCAGDFEGGAVVEVVGHGPADDGHGVQRAPLVGGADGEDLTLGRRA